MKRILAVLPFLLLVAACNQAEAPADTAVTASQSEAMENAEKPAMAMTHLVITHKVADAEQWLAAWSGENSRHDLFKANGAAHVHTVQSPTDPNLTGLIIAVKDMDALNAMLESEEGQAAAAADGVDMESMQVLIDAK